METRFKKCLRAMPLRICSETLGTSESRFSLRGLLAGLLHRPLKDLHVGGGSLRAEVALDGGHPLRCCEGT